MTENAICPFCGSDAEKRKDRVKTKINGITHNLIPNKKWYCANCKRHFKNSAHEGDFDYETSQVTKNVVS